MDELRTIWLVSVLMALARLSAAGEAALPERGPADLALSFRSPYDDSEQPYRLYLPTAYDGRRAVPLLLAMHGTGGDQNKYFDHKDYQHGIYRSEAEKRGIAVLCPFGGDMLGRPTEWRGVGELHVLAALEDVCRRFRIDADRIVCTGQSMGGTGTTYLCCRYPDLFAAGIPLASTYGHLALVANLRQVPMFYVHGADDWPVYARTGPIPLTQALEKLGYEASLWMIAGSGHNTMHVSTPRVLDWALRQRRVDHPRHVTHRAYLPLHGRAWWVELEGIDRIGWFAEIDARIEDGNSIVVALANSMRAVLRPEPQLLDLGQAIAVTVNGRRVFRGLCGAEQEIRLEAGGVGWTAAIAPRQVRSRTAYPTHPIGVVVRPPDWEGEAETSLGSWEADAMRDIAQTDIAIANKGHHRGIPLRPGQTVYLVDLINWLRPSDCALARFRLSGVELLEIIEDNIGDDPKEHRFLIQVSGCRYCFDRRRPKGQRIVSSDIDPQREYSVVAKYLSLTRTDTMNWAGRYGKIEFETLEPNTISAAWRYIQQQGGRIEAKLDGRVTSLPAEP